jgi:threonine/homoserine/homoserine lactone efflux protein
MLSFYLNFSLFALIASITPGPTNLISLMLGTQQGMLKTLPFVIGASAGAAFILLLSGLGLTSVLVNYPILRLSMIFFGALWICWLAWTLFWTLPDTLTKTKIKSMSWNQGAMLQFINPKTWMMALTVTSLYTLPDTTLIQHVSLLAIIFFAIAVPSLFFWCWLGHSASMLNNFPKWQRVINQFLAILLLVTACSTFFIA